VSTEVALNRRSVLAERYRRLGFAAPVTNRANYATLLSALQPVAPVANTRPGDPPRLLHRTAFAEGNDATEADRLRGQRELVKGRFLGGTIGYVLARDLELYATAFRRPISALDATQQLLLGVLKSLGPRTPRQLKAETGLLNREIMPTLHRLQEAFVVFEDQTSDDWGRDWCKFAAAWPDIDIGRLGWEAAAEEVVLRFLHAHVFATDEQLRNWSGFPGRTTNALIAQLANRQALIPATVEGLGSGWAAAEDYDTLGRGHLPKVEDPRGVLIIHRGDFLARSHASELKRRYGTDEVLQYLLIDGLFQGAAIGHWRIGPHDVDDITIDLPAAEKQARRDEIIEAVEWWYAPRQGHVLHYDGAELRR